jgi:hypothetical protein
VLRFSARHLTTESGVIYLEDLAPAYTEGQFRCNLNIYLLICLLIFIAFFPAHMCVVFLLPLRVRITL